MNDPKQPPVPTAGARPRRRDTRHGFYGRQFRQGEVDDLESIPAGLESEIRSLRVYARRIQELIENQQMDGDIDLGLRALNVLGMAYLRVATLLRTQAELNRDHSDFETTLNAAINAVMQEMRPCPPDEK
jgi:hypothetical protein